MKDRTLASSRRDGGKHRAKLWHRVRVRLTDTHRTYGEG